MTPHYHGHNSTSIILLHHNVIHYGMCLCILPSALTHNPHTHIPQPGPPRHMVKHLAPRTG